MTIAQRMKASEKQAICKNLVTVLKKRYQGSAPNADRPILETILFAVCLENAPPAAAAATYDRLQSEFHDLNEIRVSSITELERVFRGLTDPEWRALRIRSVLHHIFENQYTFDFEDLRRKTHDLAAKQLAKINHLSDFIRTYTLQTALDSHSVPVDDRMCAAAIWLGLADPGSTPKEASQALKPALRKNDAPLFCHLLRCFATDAPLVRPLESRLKKPPQEGFDPNTAVERLTGFFKKPTSGARKKATAAKKTASKKPAPGKRTQKNAVKVTNRKNSAAKKTAKSTTAKKRTARKKSKASR